MSYEETMAFGATQYQDVLDALAQRGYPASFTQTGGMNAGIEIHLEAGYAVLVTEADDSLSWAREEHRSWGLALFRAAELMDGECVEAEDTEDGSLAGLLAALDRLLRAAARRPHP